MVNRTVYATYKSSVVRFKHGQEVRALLTSFRTAIKVRVSTGSLRRAKCKAWYFRQLASSDDAFKAHAEFSGKSQSILIPLKLVVNGLPTSDPAIIAEGCADQQARQTTNRKVHANIIETSRLALRETYSEFTQLISDWELEAASKSFSR